ncbi:hypothetical protein ACQ31_gp128 [Salmonella phage STML-198]|uniref:Uncharacterized protein n=1 Tax=Salmonella phage STML-198 TaxID=1204531 RepID=K4I236_9CAUD|nr:hypothetical protein ACQ31_gp128 [Salmonella phage STML-198]AFU64011.1 hypothetical protein [Salmonella phage STML-198]UPW42435.1 hypothetical protein EBPHNEJP_00137 [Salmonella phage CF-SP2]
MIIVSKTSMIKYEMTIRTSSTDKVPLTVEISDEEVVFRAKGCRTEVSLNHARHYPGRMSNCIKALVLDVYPDELDIVVQELINAVRAA